MTILERPQFRLGALTFDPVPSADNQACESVTIVIRGEPAAKGRPRISTINGKGRAFTPGKTRTREGIVASSAMDVMRGRPPLAVPICVSLLAVMAIPQSWPQKRRAAALAGTEVPAKRPDLDNLLKLTTDAMNGIVFTDDALIVELRARKVYGPVPQTIIEVTPDGAGGVA